MIFIKRFAVSKTGEFLLPAQYYSLVLSVLSDSVALKAITIIFV
jgi:hypothetical protein